MNAFQIQLEKLLPKQEETKTKKKKGTKK